MAGRRRRIAVVGGANVDIGGFPAGTLVMKDSNPGVVRISAGGVGRNIAENAARLGMEAELITALGADDNGRMLLEDCRKKGILTGGCIVDANARTSVYLFIGDARGDMHCAVSDMEIQLRLTPEQMEQRLDLLNSVQAVVMDANLPEATIAYLAGQLSVPVFADAVSLAKVRRLRCALDKIYCLKTNRLEAEMLSGMQIRDALDAAEAAKRLMGMGVKRVYLTMGELGALCADERQFAFLPCAPRSIVNATGAGDAFTAALVWAHCEGMDLRECGIAGMAAADIALDAMETVSPRMSRDNLRKRMADVSARL